MSIHKYTRNVNPSLYSKKYKQLKQFIKREDLTSKDNRKIPSIGKIMALSSSFLRYTLDNFHSNKLQEKSTIFGEKESFLLSQ